MSLGRRKVWPLFAAAIIAGLTGTLKLSAGPAFTCTFNGPETVWQVSDNGTHSEVFAHDCQPGGARDQGGFERIVVAAAAGQSAYLECRSSPIAVLDELHVRIWVKSARPDIQLAARINLPRSVDSKSGKIATAMVKGTSYNRPGHWQELVVTNVPKLLAAQARIMRTTPGAEIDIREAYLESVVLIVPGDPKGVEVATDECEVEGVNVAGTVEPRLLTRDGRHVSSALKNGAPRTASTVLQVGYDEATPSAESASAAQLHGTTLLVGGKPFLTRAIDWNNEPLRFLAERGFNAVRLTSPPNPQQIADANRYDLWFICTPPRPEAIARDGLGAAGDRVLAWYLDDEALDDDPSYAQRWTETIRERDAVYGRPILVATTTSSDAALNSADVLVARDPRCSLLTGPEFAESMRSASNLGRPGTPLWASINTQFSDAVRDQINRLTNSNGPAPEVDFDQLQSLLKVACTNSIRGFMFQSRSALNESDPATRARAAAVEILNRRLQLLEGWLAGGKVVANVTSTNGALTAAVMYVDRARLLISVSAQSPTTSVAPGKKPATNEITFLVPGVSESSQVHFLTPVSLRTVLSERVAGGTRFSIPSTDGLVLITEDPKVAQSLRQHIARHGAQTLRLERELIVERARSMMQCDQKLAQLGHRSSVGAAFAADVNGRITALDAAMNSSQFEQAQTLIHAALADSRRAIADRQRQLMPPDSLQSNALNLSADRLADLVALEQSISQLQTAGIQLEAGDFENLGAMTQAGWQHIVHARASGTASAELSADRPRSGTYCLKLEASANVGAALPARTDPLVWIVSPPMPLDENKIVEITGWVRVDKPFDTPGSGLVIMDTIGGPELSLVVDKTSGWQSFRMLRAVPQTTELRLTFALTGAGAADVDGVMVRALEQPTPRRLPETSGADSAAPETAEAPGPITRLPNPR